MSITDRLWLPDKPIEGHAKLELRDARTGKLQERVEADNYITTDMVQLLKWYSRAWMYTWCNVGVASVDPNPAMPASTNYIAFMLTDAAHPEDPTNDRLMTGRAIAYAQGTYTGGSSARGTFNYTESSRGGLPTPKSIMVVDWPTNSGNGTIQTVYSYWMAFGASSSDIFLENTNTAVWSTGAGFGDIWNDSFSGITGVYAAAGGLYLDPDGVSYWLQHQSTSSSTAGTLVKRQLGTGNVTGSIPFTGVGPMATTSYGWFTNDGAGAVGNWWFMGSDRVLHKMPAAGGTVTTVGSALPNYGTIVFGGGYLWLWASPNFYQIDPVSGNVITTIPISSAWLGGDYTPGLYSPYWLAYRPDSYNGDELIYPGYAYYSNGYYGQGMAKFSTAGIIKMHNAFAGQAYYQGPNWEPVPAQMAMLPNASGWVGNDGNNRTWRANTLRQYISRALLPSPVTKSNTQTMKLTYEFDYS